jgi:Integrase core domain/Winged helix-turn helix
MTQEQKIIRAKVGLLEPARQLGNVSRACKMLGSSRDSFYRFKELYDTGGELALAEISRRKPILKNRTPAEVEEAVVAIALGQPARGQVRVAEAVRRQGLSISPAGVRCVWQRHDLETMKKRLKALEAKSAQDGLVLTEAQLAALERARADGEAHGGEFESECPGYCGAQAGHLLRRHHEGGGAGLPAELHRHLRQGRLRQALRPQDPDHRGRPAERPRGAVLRRARGGALPGADRPRDRVLRQPGAARVHGYQLYLAVEDVDHTRTKTKSPQTNGICERFHRTALDEFYRVAFRKKLCRGVEELQADLDRWVAEYNERRPHQGRWCYGKTPMQTFLDAIPLAREKIMRH